MLQDSSLVRKMDDHGMLYGLPEAEERLQFLLDDNRPLRTFDEEFKWEAVHADLTDDLQDILQVFRRIEPRCDCGGPNDTGNQTKRTVLRKSADSGDAADDIRSTSYPNNRA